MTTPPDGGSTPPGSHENSPGAGPRKKSLFLRLFDDSLAVAYAGWVIRWRWAAIASSLLVAGAIVFAALNAGDGQLVRFSSDYRVFFSSENPQLKAFERMQRVYSKDDNISFVIKPASGDVFTPELLDGIRKLTASAWKMPFATRVDSLTNFQHSFAQDDDLTVQDLVSKSAALTPGDIARIRAVALAEPLLVKRTISADGTTTNVNVTLTFPQKSEAETPAAMAHARKLATAFEAAHPNVRVAITGLVALNWAFFETSMKDMSTLVPLMYAVLVIAMVALLRSASGAFATMTVVGLSAVTAMGLAGWLGIRLTPPSSVAPTVVLTLAVADSIHVLVTMFMAMRGGASKYDAIVESLRVNFGPVFLTSLTTAIGFLSLNFSDAPPFADLGNITAIGVAAAWIYSILFLPALMAVLPVRIKQRARPAHAGMDRLAEFVIARHRPLLFLTAALVLVLGAMVPRIELNDQFVKYFEPSIQFRADTDFASENLSGMYQLQWSLPAAGAGGISEPEYLQRVDAFAEWLRQRPEVMHVQTLTDTFRRLNKNMHGDDDAWYRLPDERKLSAQYLLLFEMSLPYGLDLNNQINVDKSAMRVIATTQNMPTRKLRTLDDEGAIWLKANLSPRASNASGPIMMFAYISQRNIESMLTGTITALFLISLSLMLALRHFKLGLISLVPNLIPAVMAFGIWSIFVGEVGLASSIVTATSLGIVVDATVHFLSKYLRAQREKGLPAEDAVRYAFSTVGTALLVTAAILIAGFGILSLSAFKLNENMGLLTAIAIACALVADFLLLPALLIAIDRRRKPSEKDPGYAETLATTPAA